MVGWEGDIPDGDKVLRLQIPYDCSPHNLNPSPPAAFPGHFQPLNPKTNHFSSLAVGLETFKPSAISTTLSRPVTVTTPTT